MFFKKKPFKLGDSVRFKDGQKDEDSDVDMSGWQGRVIEIDTRQKLVLVALDSLTLKSLPREYLEESEEEGLNWAEYYIGFDDVELIQPRDTQKVVEETVTALSNSVGWAFLGEEGRGINAVLAGADNEHAQMEAWKAHLQKTLTFPFQAKITEWQKPGSILQSGHKVRVMSIHGLDDLYGVLVKIKRGGVLTHSPYVIWKWWHIIHPIVILYTCMRFGMLIGEVEHEAVGASPHSRPNGSCRRL